MRVMSYTHDSDIGSIYIHAFPTKALILEFRLSRLVASEWFAKDNQAAFPIPYATPPFHHPSPYGSGEAA